MKICPGCLTEKPLTDFVYDRRFAGYRRPDCKTCVATAKHDAIEHNKLLTPAEKAFLAADSKQSRSQQAVYQARHIKNKALTKAQRKTGILPDGYELNRPGRPVSAFTQLEHQRYDNPDLAMQHAREHMFAQMDLPPDQRQPYTPAMAWAIRRNDFIQQLYASVRVNKPQRYKTLTEWTKPKRATRFNPDAPKRCTISDAQATREEEKLRHLSPQGNVPDWAPTTARDPKLIRLIQRTEKRYLASKKKYKPVPAIPRGTLTQAVLRTLVEYQPDSGNFIWLTGRNAGLVAGVFKRILYHASHAGKRHVDKHRGIPPTDPRRYRSNKPKPCRGGSIIKGVNASTRGHQKNAVLRTYKHRDPKTGSITEHHYFVRPYEPSLTLRIGGVVYPGWQLAYLYMGAGGVWDYPTPNSPPNDIILPQIRTSTPETNTALTYPALKTNRPTRVNFRDHNTLNLAWENIKPEPPTAAELQKFINSYVNPRRKRVKSRANNIITPEKCIKKVMFNKLTPQFTVKLPNVKERIFWTYDDAMTYYTEAFRM